MISTENKAVNQETPDHDFTVESYRQLLRLAISGYDVSSYADIPWGNRFVLWRHDLDFSLNRGLVLAKIECQEGLTATYFINPHSEFYNISERSQHKIIQEILALGHDLGLHFDAKFYDATNEQDLDRLVAKEARDLKELFGVQPVAFSFHNPVAAHMTFAADHYGGLVNCCSSRFRTEVAYCSDSNGYWRFRPLHNVLFEAKDPCLQVLTHPGWWQDVTMPPRQRVFRSAYGRARATMDLYDAVLQDQCRLNRAGPADCLRFLKASQPQLFDLCDYLWNQGHFQTLFVELWRLHASQMYRLCKAHLSREWRIPVAELNAFFGVDGMPVDGCKLFNAPIEEQWSEAAGVNKAEYKSWVKTRNQLIHGRSPAEPGELEMGCVYLCRIIHNLAEWGKQQSMAYDGLAHLGRSGCRHSRRRLVD